MAEQNTSTREFKPAPEAENLYRRWIAHLDRQFTEQQGPDQRDEIVRDELYQIFLGRPHGGKGNSALTTELASCVLAESFDPGNATLGTDLGPNFDVEKYLPIRPLIWFWRMFDRSPLGQNHWLGLRFRCMLGNHIFAKIGKGVKIYPEVRFMYGYNLTIEDNCIIRRGAVLDDREPLTIREGTTVNDGERVGGQSQQNGQKT